MSTSNPLRRVAVVPDPASRVRGMWRGKRDGDVEPGPRSCQDFHSCANGLKEEEAEDGRGRRRRRRKRRPNERRTTAGRPYEANSRQHSRHPCLRCTERGSGIESRCEIGASRWRSLPGKLRRLEVHAPNCVTSTQPPVTQPHAAAATVWAPCVSTASAAPVVAGGGR